MGRRGDQTGLSQNCQLNTVYCGFAAPMSPDIKVENLSKRYRLGVISRDCADII